MPRRPQGPRYQPARSALNQHLYRHHSGAQGFGDLSERLAFHGELHVIGPRMGVEPDHDHEFGVEGEEKEDEAFRMLNDGEHGRATDG